MTPLADLTATLESILTRIRLSANCKKAFCDFFAAEGAASLVQRNIHAIVANATATSLLRKILNELFFVDDSVKDFELLLTFDAFPENSTVCFPSADDTAKQAFHQFANFKRHLFLFFWAQKPLLAANPPDPSFTGCFFEFLHFVFAVIFERLSRHNVASGSHEKKVLLQVNLFLRFADLFVFDVEGHFVGKFLALLSESNPLRIFFGWSQLMHFLLQMRDHFRGHCAVIFEFARLHFDFLLLLDDAHFDRVIAASLHAPEAFAFFQKVCCKTGNCLRLWRALLQLESAPIIGFEALLKESASALKPAQVSTLLDEFFEAEAENAASLPAFKRPKTPSSSQFSVSFLRYAPLTPRRLCNVFYHTVLIERFEAFRAASFDADLQAFFAKGRKSIDDLQNIFVHFRYHAAALEILSSFFEVHHASFVAGVFLPHYFFILKGNSDSVAEACSRLLLDAALHNKSLFSFEKLPFVCWECRVFREAFADVLRRFMPLPLDVFCTLPPQIFTLGDVVKFYSDEQIASLAFQRIISYDDEQIAALLAKLPRASSISKHFIKRLSRRGLRNLLAETPAEFCVGIVAQLVYAACTKLSAVALEGPAIRRLFIDAFADLSCCDAKIAFVIAKNKSLLQNEQEAHAFNSFLKSKVFSGSSEFFPAYIEYAGCSSQTFCVLLAKANDCEIFEHFLECCKPDEVIEVAKCMLVLLGGFQTFFEANPKQAVAFLTCVKAACKSPKFKVFMRKILDVFYVSLLNFCVTNEHVFCQNDGTLCVLFEVTEFYVRQSKLAHKKSSTMQYSVQAAILKFVHSLLTMQPAVMKPVHLKLSFSVVLLITEKVNGCLLGFFYEILKSYFLFFTEKIQQPVSCSVDQSTAFHSSMLSKLCKKTAEAFPKDFGKYAARLIAIGIKCILGAKTPDLSNEVQKFLEKPLFVLVEECRKMQHEWIMQTACADDSAKGLFKQLFASYEANFKYKGKV